MADDVSTTKPKGILQKLVVEMVFLSMAFTFAFGAWILHFSIGDSTGVTKFISPENKQKVWIKKDEPVRFSWAGQARPDTVLEIAKDPEFQNIVLQVINPTSPHLANRLLGEGDYYYRFIRRDLSENAPPPESVAFTVVTQESPQLNYPFSPAVFPEEKQVRFYWKAKHGINFYRLQIAHDSSFKNILNDVLVNGTQTSPQAIPVGEFYWRVRGEGEGSSTTLWSEVRALQMKGSLNKVIAKAVEPAAPVASTILPAPPPPQAAVVQPIKTQPAPAIAQTNSKPSSRQRDREKTNTRTPASVQKAVVTSPPVKVAKTEKPTVSESPAPKKVAKVISKQAPQRKPQSVEVVPVEKIVNIAAPLPKLPPNGVSIVSFAGAQQPIVFKWEVTDADNYRLEVAADEGFQKILHTAVVSENQEVVTKPLPKGKLYWRVRAQRGTQSSEWSQTFNIEFAK